MTMKPQLQTIGQLEAEQQKPKEVNEPELKSNREWKLNLVGVYFKTFETLTLMAKEPPKHIQNQNFVLINFGMVMDERNVERGLATYAEDVGDWPKYLDFSINLQRNNC